MKNKHKECYGRERLTKRDRKCRTLWKFCYNFYMCRIYLIYRICQRKFYTRFSGKMLGGILIHGGATLTPFTSGRTPSVFEHL